MRRQRQLNSLPTTTRAEQTAPLLETSFPDDDHCTITQVFRCRMAIHDSDHQLGSIHESQNNQRLQNKNPKHGLIPFDRETAPYHFGPNSLATSTPGTRVLAPRQGVDPRGGGNGGRVARPNLRGIESPSSPEAAR